MQRTIGYMSLVLVLSPTALAAEDSLAEVFAALDAAVGQTQKLAFIRPEATGTAEDLSGLEEHILKHLSSEKKQSVIPPEAVFAKAGPEFEVSAEGIAGVAKKMAADAALFVGVFKSPEQIEVHLWLVDAEAKVLLDKSFRVASLPPGKKPPPAPEPQTTSPVAAPGPPKDFPGGAAPREDDTSEAFERRRLALVPRQRVAGGASIGLAGSHLAVGIQTPVVITTDWMIVEGDQPISEIRLAQMAGQAEIVKRIQADIDSLKMVRNLGIGMTLGGFVTAAVAAPFFKAEGSSDITAAGVAVGTGLAVGIAGLVLWIIYGPDAALAETPHPANHLITQPEAEEMVENCNHTLRRELNLDPVEPTSQRPAVNPRLRFSLLPHPQGASVALRVDF